MKKVEALKGSTVVKTTPSWQDDECDAATEARRECDYMNLDYDAVRVSEAANIYDAHGIA